MILRHLGRVGITDDVGAAVVTSGMKYLLFIEVKHLHFI
jgi:hypothetical protein